MRVSVAAIVGLAHPNSVHLYQRRYRDMPQPVLDRGGRRARLWLRSKMSAWALARPGFRASDANDESPGIRVGTNNALKWYIDGRTLLVGVVVLRRDSGMVERSSQCGMVELCSQCG